jgi:hypothetical protein
MWQIFTFFLFDLEVGSIHCAIQICFLTVVNCILFMGGECTSSQMKILGMLKISLSLVVVFYGVANKFLPLDRDKEINASCCCVTNLFTSVSLVKCRLGGFQRLGTETL